MSLANFSVESPKVTSLLRSRTFFACLRTLMGRDSPPRRPIQGKPVVSSIRAEALEVAGGVPLLPRARQQRCCGAGGELGWSPPNALRGTHARANLSANARTRALSSVRANAFSNARANNGPHSSSFSPTACSDTGGDTAPKAPVSGVRYVGAKEPRDNERPAESPGSMFRVRCGSA